MFPDITRDDVFRLETRRLWLRWPTKGDAPAMAALLAQKHAGSRHGLSVLADEAVLRNIERCRDECAAGEALHLVLTPKLGDRGAIGLVRIARARSGEPELDYCLLRDHQGQGLMAEAVFASLDAAFLLGAVPRVFAAPRALDPAARRVLERCGFTFVGAGLGPAGQTPGLAACDVFCLDRRTWRSLKSWTVPDFGSTGLGFDASPPCGGLPC